jgi:L,D-peptidoglycan transpeptidase YkuD (ErfK/YbiS/YcfS/YnhG family)
MAGSDARGESRLDSTHSSSPLRSSPLAQTRQLVLVLVKDWESVDGAMQCYERADVDAPWQAIGTSAPVVVGRNGLAWGRGLHDPQSSGPGKTEGDGKAPAGAFRLSCAFGYAPTDQAGAVKLPYLQLTSALECVDDAQSAHYNQIIDRSLLTAPDWRSSEQMLRPDERYRWGVVVDHNADPALPQAGSCIFLHIWERASVGTAGCTAMEPARLEGLLRWLDPATRPVLVQLPEREFQRLRSRWELPALI